MIAVKSTQSLPGWLGVALSKTMLAIREVLIAMLVGGLPVCVAFFSGGIPQLTGIINSYVPPVLILKFQVVYFGMYALIVLIERFILPRTDSNRQALIFVRSIFHEAGAGVIGIWRILSGGLIVHLFLWFFVEPETFSWLKALAITTLVFAMLVESAVMSDWLDRLQRKIFRSYRAASDLIVFDTSSTWLKAAHKKAL